jgi:hypothetical protein
MINVRSSNDFRSGIQNGFWGIKYLLIIGGMVGAFFIPEYSFGNFLINKIKFRNCSNMSHPMNYILCREKKKEAIGYSISRHSRVQVDGPPKHRHLIQKL